MPMSVEAAVITKKSSLLDFNTDSVNAAGKLWPRETVHSEKGIRAAGLCKDKPYYVLTSSKTKGTAESAADLFKTCAENFSEDGENCSELLADFFKAFSRVLIDAGFESSDCDFSVFAGFGTNVYIGKSGKSRAYAFYDGEFTEIDPEEHELYDGKSTYGIACCNNVKEGDIFILLTEKVASTLTGAVVAAICRTAQGDIKKISALISSQAAKLGCTDAVSAVVLRIKEAVPVPAAAPSEEAAPSAADKEDGFSFVAPVPENGNEVDNETASAVEELSDGGESNKGKRLGVVILSVILGLLILAIAFFAIKIISQMHSDNNGESISESIEESDESETESETEKESESESEEESSEETGTEETTEESEATTAVPVVTVPTTRQSSTTTTTRPETPTEREPDTTREAETESQTEAPTEETEPSSEQEGSESSSSENSQEPSSSDETPATDDSSENTPAE